MIFKIGMPVTIKIIDFFKSHGFRESEMFTKSGLLYIDDQDVIITGTLGSDKLQIKCKKNDRCEEALNKVESYLQSMATNGSQTAQ